MQQDMQKNVLQAININASLISGREILKLMAILWKLQGCSKEFNVYYIT